MPYATVSGKGQITLPVKLRRELGIEVHDRVAVSSDGERIVIQRVGDLMELKGFLGKAKPADGERGAMMKAVSAHVLGQEEGGRE